MKKGFIVAGVVVLISLLSISEVASEEKVLVLRQAREERGGAAMVEVHLVGNVLEAKVSIRMFRTKPKIANVILVGPKIGRMSPTSIKEILATLEDEAPYETIKRGGFITFDENKKTKDLQGTVVRKMFKFKIPPEKIIPGGKYQLWVKSKEEGYNRRGKRLSYKFDLEKLPQLIK